MTRTPDEIKKGQSLYTPEEVKAILQQKWTIHLQEKLYRSAFVYIQQLEAQNAEQAEKIRELYAYIGEANKNLDCLQAKLDTKLDSVEAGVVQLFQYCKELQTERDAAVKDIRMLLTSYKGACKTCIHGKDQDDCDVGVGCEYCQDINCPCKTCKNGYCNWQWRGVQQEE